MLTYSAVSNKIYKEDTCEDTANGFCKKQIIQILIIELLADSMLFIQLFADFQ